MPILFPPANIFPWQYFSPANIFPLCLHISHVNIIFLCQYFSVKTFSSCQHFPLPIFSPINIFNLSLFQMPTFPHIFTFLYFSSQCFPPANISTHNFSPINIFLRQYFPLLVYISSLQGFSPATYFLVAIFSLSNIFLPNTLWMTGQKLRRENPWPIIYVGLGL